MKNLIFTAFLLLSSPIYALEYGIDRLNEPEINQALEGKRLGVLTHLAARNKAGEHLIDLLHGPFKLIKIFAPEHGLRHLADDWVGDGTDEVTGLPVISLYKRGSKAPKPEDLKDLDAVIIDLQDVGVRYYTYFSTIAEVMKVCAAVGVEVILLDRPNLLGGKIVEGKVLDPSLAGNFTAYHTVPTRHGMTLGELALMVNQEKKINARLKVIPVRDWQRESLLKDTERAWIPPSPALIELSQVGLYALWGALENFNIAVGRGQNNELAFKVLGAPWITPEESATLARELNALGFEGLSFTSFSWKVTRAQHQGKVAHGVKLDWSGKEVRTDEFTYKVASVLVRLFSDRISGMSPYGYGSKEMTEAIRTGVAWEIYGAKIDKELENFKERRKPFLLY